MLESMYEYMKLGIVHFMAFPDTLRGEGPIAESVAKIAADDYFTAIELTWVKDPEEKARVKQVLDTSGLTVAYAAQPAVLITPLDPNSLDDAVRQQAVDALKAEIDSAYDIGARGLAFLSGKDPGEDRRAAATEALVDTCRQLCDDAKSKGELKIVLETFDRTIDKKALIGPSDEAAALAEAINRSNFGLMVDLSHLPLQYESAEEALHTVKDYLVHAHVGNCIMWDADHVGYGDYHPPFGVPEGENGVAELTNYLRVLFEIGYLDGDNEELPILSSEVKPLPGGTSEIVIANAKRTMNEAWARR